MLKTNVMQALSPVLIKMGEYVDQWKASNDGRHIFLSCYHLMSTNMMVSLQNKEFNDHIWVDQLLHRFADYYFESLSCYDCGDATPEVWNYAHKATSHSHLSEIQLLILGVNAHINYDLVLALYDLLKPEWNSLSEDQKLQRYNDHFHVNKVIANTIDKVQDDVLAPLSPELRWIDRLLGRLDEYLISKLILSWREEVWENTQHLLSLEPLEEQEKFRQELERAVLKKADLIAMF